MIHTLAWYRTLPFLSLILCLPLYAEETVPERPSPELLLGTTAEGRENLDFDRVFERYDEDGFPQDRTGMLVLADDDEGPMVYMEGEEVPYLLYALYDNRQRDAVILARTGTRTDVLPTGEPYEVPYGFGTVKQNVVSVSIIEGLIAPHFSDNRKEYSDFPLEDLYLGLSFGTTGLDASVRYVRREALAFHASLGVNVFGSMVPGSTVNYYSVPFHLGAGYRFPGPFPDLVGDLLLTLGADVLFGIGDRDGDPSTSGFLGLPGIFLDIERALIDERGIGRDVRSDPRPYNYRVNAVVLRAAVYLDFVNPDVDGILLPALSLSYSYNIVGPRIPDHSIKETRVLYLNELYREDLERQKARRDARSGG